MNVKNVVYCGIIGYEGMGVTIRDSISSIAKLYRDQIRESTEGTPYNIIKLK